MKDPQRYLREIRIASEEVEGDRKPDDTPRGVLRELHQTAWNETAEGHYLCFGCFFLFFLFETKKE